MPLTVHSPHSGKPVKVREEDLGRALRDEGGRVFYALETADGQGVYGAVTRKGSPEEETRYQNQDWRLSEEELTQDDSNQASDTTDAPAHDATGPGRKAPASRYVFITLLALLIAGGGYGVYRQYFCGCGTAQPGLAPDQTTIDTLEAPKQEGTQDPDPPSAPQPTADTALPADSAVSAE